MHELAGESPANESENQNFLFLPQIK
jgi:hypothetical protein